MRPYAKEYMNINCLIGFPKTYQINLNEEPIEHTISSRFQSLIKDIKSKQNHEDDPDNFLNS